MKPGLLITFEGTEGSGKSTQITRLAERLQASGYSIRTLREPGGTAIGEEIRHTLQHSQQNQAMFPETELLLLNASRAQLVRETIRPALARGEIVLCDRYFDSSLAYQGYGRGLALTTVQAIIDYAVDECRPDLTIYLHVPVAVSESRRASRQSALPTARDRIEESDRAFFERVEHGYLQLASADPKRIRVVDATKPINEIADQLWAFVEAILNRKVSA
jgi:dTMP kinase